MALVTFLVLARCEDEFGVFFEKKSVVCNILHNTD